jgi:hypothetical protein
MRIGSGARCLLCGWVRPDLEEHHIGGKTHSTFTVLICGPCHHEVRGITASQASYQHLLAREDAPEWLQRVLWDADLAAFLERLAIHLRRRVRDTLAPHLHNSETRSGLRRTGLRR